MTFNYYWSSFFLVASSCRCWINYIHIELSWSFMLENWYNVAYCVCSALQRCISPGYCIDVQLITLAVNTANRKRAVDNPFCVPIFFCGVRLTCRALDFLLCLSPDKWCQTKSLMPVPPFLQQQNKDPILRFEAVCMCGQKNVFSFSILGRREIQIYLTALPFIIKYSGQIWE